MWSNAQQPKKKKKKQKGAPKHLVRAQAQIKKDNDILNARIVLNDFKPTGVEVYCTGKLTKGQKIALTLDHPKRFYSNGVILWCEELQLGHRIISENPFSFRVGIQFTFASDEEKKTVAEYAEEILTNCLGGLPKDMKKKLELVETPTEPAKGADEVTENQKEDSAEPAEATQEKQAA